MFDLLNILQRIEPYRQNIDWLSNIDIRRNSIAHFGCSIGEETLALLMLLNPQEIVGIDIEADSLWRAQREILNSLSSLRSVRRNLYYSPNLTNETKEILVELSRRFEGQKTIGFVRADITIGTGLTPAHFDLAYCERVLDNIAWDDTSPKYDRVLSAIREMARIIRPDGHVAAIEHTALRDGRSLPLGDLFAQAGLVPDGRASQFALQDGKSVLFYKFPV